MILDEICLKKRKRIAERKKSVAIDELYKKYPSIIDKGVVIHDTVNDVISRIQRTEYKRKRLPIVPDIKFE